jgi:hypothetical protein
VLEPSVSRQSDRRPPWGRAAHLMMLPSESAATLSVELAPKDVICNAVGEWRHNGALRGEGSPRLRPPAILRARGQRGRAERVAGAGWRDWAVGDNALDDSFAQCCPIDRTLCIVVDRGPRRSGERARRPAPALLSEATAASVLLAGGAQTGGGCPARRGLLDRSGRWSQLDLAVLGNEDALVRAMRIVVVGATGVVGRQPVPMIVDGGQE